MNKLFKIIAATAAAAVLAASSLCASAAGAGGFALQFSASSDFATVQGEKNWYYQIYRSGEYEDLYYSADTGRWMQDGTGGTYITAERQHPGNPGINTARVWEAPIAGVVRLSSTENVRKTGIGGPGVTASIKKNGNTLWSQFIEGTDKIGYSYSVDVEVNAGDRIYFEVSATGTSYGETGWTPTVNYVQAAEFSANGNAVKSMSEVNKGDTLICTLYDNYTIDEPSAAYLAVYDNEGRLRAVSDRSDFDLKETDGYTEVSVTVDAVAESYEGWSAELIVLTGTDGRFWPIAISDNICL